GEDCAVSIGDVLSAKRDASQDAERGGVSRAIISPDKPSNMLKFARECREHGIPYIFDPAQQIGLFEDDELLTAISGAEILIVNEYEAGLLESKLGLVRAKIATMAGIYIETHGARGAAVQVNLAGRACEMLHIAAVAPTRLIDPTGCGDAFRAGVLVGLQRGFGIEKACRVGALLATYSLECAGTQSHSFTLARFADRFKESFGESF
ncbi:carbohydrate kinase family protein, partial [Patescibacteria group bacterium]|nr:carbohydrate kinase family protein [Patescibacteria group bacterium]